MTKFSTFLSLLVFTIAGFGQPINDDCLNAEQLCASQVLQGTTTAATNLAAEDNNFCTLNSATVWYKFTTNSSGGTVTIGFSNLSFNPGATFGQSIDAVIFSASTPCDQTSYTPVSACSNSSVGFNVVSAIALNANTTYYVLVNGTAFGAGVSSSAECDFDITISGPGVSASIPVATISAVDTVLCEGDSEPVTTTISNCTDTSSFDWYYNNVLIESGSTNTFNTNSLSSSGWLKLVFNCGNLCIYSDTTDSIYYDVTNISASAGPDKFIAEGDLTTLEGTGSGTPTWSPASSLTDANIFQPIATPNNTTTYFLTVQNGSCFATDSVNVFIGELITIYTAFTPNSDNKNDKWVIKNSAQYPNMEVIVYDRAGQRVFNTTGYSTPDKWWDGTYKNKLLPVSTYFYVIDLKIGDEGIYKGQVSIIR
jgi:gliding motility-associated-like protein